MLRMLSGAIPSTWALAFLALAFKLTLLYAPDNDRLAHLPVTSGCVLRASSYQFTSVVGGTVYCALRTPLVQRVTQSLAVLDY